MSLSVFPRILCIDDDELVLDGLSLTLRKLGDVSCALGGQEGLKLARETGPFTVVICDMRMPGKSGADVLADFKVEFPQTTRLLLTGYSDVGDAVKAVNQGAIFRFLQKPCDPVTLTQQVTAAIAEHRLLSAEQDLLENTLMGCLHVLAEGLATTSPRIFSRFQRTCSLVRPLVFQDASAPFWIVETAILLSGLSQVSLSDAIQDKLQRNLPLLAAEQAQADMALAALLNALSRIPRIERVVDLLKLMDSHFQGPLHSEPAMLHLLERQAKMVRLVRRYMVLETDGIDVDAALQRLRTDGDQPIGWIDALEHRLKGHESESPIETRMELRLSQLKPGMVLLSPIFNVNGTLLASAGHTISEGFWRRISELRPELTETVVPVIVPLPKRH